MYLTVDKEFIIKKEDIIGIFNIESIKNTNEFKAIFEKLKNDGKILNYAKNETKSFILYKKENELYGIIAGVASSSIEKRGKSKLV